MNCKYEATVTDGTILAIMVLPYHLYILATQPAQAGLVRPIDYRIAPVLMLLVLLLSMPAILLKNDYGEKMKCFNGHCKNCQGELE